MENKIGKFFTINGKDLWRLIGYCENPTATFENMITKERKHGAVGSIIINEFKELTLEDKVKLLIDLGSILDGEEDIVVCDKCHTASCWHGIFLCDESRNAGTTTLKRKELIEKKLEHPSYIRNI